MQIKTAKINLLIILLILIGYSCSFNSDRIAKLKKFAFYIDRIEQNDTIALATDNQEIESNYFGDRKRRKLSDTLTDFPLFTSPSPLLNVVYQLSLEEAKNINKEISLSDLCYSSILALAVIKPQKCKELLLQKVEQFNIQQNTDKTNGWPVNSQRVLWGMASYKVYNITGDKVWLRKIFTITKRAVDADLNVIWNYKKQLFRGSVDVANTIYPSNFTPIDIFNSYSLRTQVLYYRNLQLLIDMGRLLNRDMLSYKHLQRALKRSITVNFWLPKQQIFAGYICGNNNFLKSEQRDILAEAMGVIWDIFDDTKQLILTQEMPFWDFGIPTILPLYQNRNAEISALTQAYCTKALVKGNCTKSVNWGIANTVRTTALTLKNSNSWSAITGKPIPFTSNGLGAASVLSLYYDVLLGLHLDNDKAGITPFIPKKIGQNDTIRVRNLKYRNSILNVDIIGYGNKIAQCTINKKVSDKAEIAATVEGEQNIVIHMNNKLPKQIRIIKGERSEMLKTPKLKVKNDTIFWGKNTTAKRYKLYKNGKLWLSVTDTFFPDTIYKPYWFSVQSIGRKNQKSNYSKELLLKPGAYQRIVNAGIFQSFNTKPYVILHADSVFTFRVRVPRDGRYLIAFIYDADVEKNGCISRSFWNNDNYLGTCVFPVYVSNKQEVMCTNAIEMEVFRGYNKFKLTNEKFNRQNNSLPDRLKIKKIKLIRVE